MAKISLYFVSVQSSIDKKKQVNASRGKKKQFIFNKKLQTKNNHSSEIWMEFPFRSLDINETNEQRKKQRLLH